MKSNLISALKHSLKRISLVMLGLLLVASSLFANPMTASADTITVKMGSDKGALVFEPKEVTIKPGDTVKWVNNKAFPHNIIFDSNPEASHKKLLLKPNIAAESTFNEVGEFSYYCTPHRGAGMVGKVIVAG
jgi:plastocyanin